MLCVAKRRETCESNPFNHAPLGALLRCEVQEFVERKLCFKGCHISRDVDGRVLNSEVFFSLYLEQIPPASLEAGGVIKYLSLVKLMNKYRSYAMRRAHR